MKRHFACNACGRCCHGKLPLSIDDALAHSELFPLFLMWTPVRPGSKSYDVIRKIGLEIEPKKGTKAAVRITPVSYVPSNLPCPALTQDGLCGIQDNKPLRCQTMPFSGVRAEDDQDDLLIPGPGWNCNITEGAPLVYQDHKIVDRVMFVAERQRLEEDAKILAPFAQFVLDAKPDVRKEVFTMALRPHGGHVITPFSHLIARLPQVDMFDFAAKQQALMEVFTELTEDNPDQIKEHEHYSASFQAYSKMLEA